MKKNQPTPGVDRGTLERQRCAVPLNYANIGVQHVENINVRARVYSRIFERLITSYSKHENQ